ncbi:MAG TPA: DUF763 domain-containing protein [Pyrinomonadaceae bacterium]|jgi:hypothetical protein|nr:DUF763 domain-containing protein [Pyrinomonadaceae bacterium]
MKRSGVADLPLHAGRVPEWLAQRMTQLGASITEAIVLDYGTSSFLSRLSDPFWFQALGAVMGMDWHSSGITTSVMGALKRGLAAKSDELGIYICGGRGKFSRNTPNELRAISHRHGFDGEALVRTSRLTARIDNNAIADGFQIYLHSFVLARNGEWAVVQQGLNDQTGMARRYHWHSATVRDFVAEPHSGIVGAHQGLIMNLVDAQAKPAQTAMLDIVHEHPDKTLREATAVARHTRSQAEKPLPAMSRFTRYLRMPGHHDVRSGDVDLKRLGAVLAIAYERDLHDFAELLLTEKLGPRTLQSLALVAEVIHGTSVRFNDPARFSFAHGGKDGHPFPVPLKTYAESLNFLRNVLDQAKPVSGAPGDRDPVQFGREKLEALRRLNRFARSVEDRLGPHPDFDAVVTYERKISPALGGRTVMDDRPRRNFFVGRTGQRSLF